MAAEQTRTVLMVGGPADGQVVTVEDATLIRWPHETQGHRPHIVTYVIHQTVFLDRIIYMALAPGVEESEDTILKTLLTPEAYALIQGAPHVPGW